MNLMTLVNQIELQAYGTPEGVEKEWDERGRGRKDATRHKEFGNFDKVDSNAYSTKDGKHNVYIVDRGDSFAVRYSTPVTTRTKEFSTKEDLDSYLKDRYGIVKSKSNEPPPISDSDSDRLRKAIFGK